MLSPGLLLAATQPLVLRSSHHTLHCSCLHTIHRSTVVSRTSACSGLKRCRVYTIVYTAGDAWGLIRTQEKEKEAWVCAETRGPGGGTSVQAMFGNTHQGWWLSRREGWWWQGWGWRGMPAARLNAVANQSHWIPGRNVARQ